MSLTHYFCISQDWWWHNVMVLANSDEYLLDCGFAVELDVWRVFCSCFFFTVCNHPVLRAFIQQNCLSVCQPWQCWESLCVQSRSRRSDSRVYLVFLTNEILLVMLACPKFQLVSLCQAKPGAGNNGILLLSLGFCWKSPKKPLQTLPAFPWPLELCKT